MRLRRLTLALLLASTLAVAQRAGGARDAWQRPEEVMDALGASPGSAVADIGAGDGYFTRHLARRVGPGGRVYAVDIDDDSLARLRRLAEKEKLPQVEVVEGATTDPRLPAAALDAVLVVNAYHEFREHEAMLHGIRSALRPGGVLVIIDDTAPPGWPRERFHQRHKIDPEVVRADAEAAGFRFLRRQPDLRTAEAEDWFFLVFEKPATSH